MQRYACTACAKGVTAPTDADAHEREGGTPCVEGRVPCVDAGTNERAVRPRFADGCILPAYAPTLPADADTNEGDA